MTDREFLQALKSMIDAQLQSNSIPVGPPVIITTPPPAPVVPTNIPNIPGMTPTPILDNPGGPPPANVNYLEAADYDIRALNGPRRYTNGNNSHFITPDRDCTLILHVGKMPGNVPDKVMLYVSGGGESESLEIPTTDQLIRVRFSARAGVRYVITISSPEVFALEITAELQ